jgi:dGTPase
MKNPLSEEQYASRQSPKEYPIRGEYFRDQTAIIHSMPFRRLKHKTQVFFSPDNDHVCTRIEHVLHVATIGATICKGLNNKGWDLNPEMAYAIGLGHDLGHSPFGHAGETALNKKLNSEFKFIHEVHSLRVVDKLCNDGKGLNLTYGVRDGIINHNGEILQQSLKPTLIRNNLEEIHDRKSLATSFEGCIVRFADKVAYLGRDIEDALIADFISINEIPEKIRDEVGSTNGEIINNLIIDIITTSKDLDEIKLSDEMFEKVKLLQNFNYKKIYGHEIITKYRLMGENILEELFDYLLDLYSNQGQNFGHYSISKIELNRHFGGYINRYKNVYETEGLIPKRIVCDFIAGMTDNYALNAFNQIKIPTAIKFK